MAMRMAVNALDPVRIRDLLDAETARWVVALDVFDTIDSTNTFLMRRAAEVSVNGCVCIAEHQS